MSKTPKKDKPIVKIVEEKPKDDEKQDESEHEDVEKVKDNESKKEEKKTDDDAETKAKYAHTEREEQEVTSARSGRMSLLSCVSRSWRMSCWTLKKSLRHA